MVLDHSMNAGSVMETLKPYHMQKNLFELFALTGSGMQKRLVQKLLLAPKSHQWGTCTTFN